MRYRHLALLAIVGLAASSASAQDISWNNAAGGSWNLAANWSPANIPDAPGERAIISLSGMYTVTLASSVAVGQLALGNPAVTLAINNSQLLAVAGPQFTNEGTIVVNPTAGGSGTHLRIDAPLTLDGSGEILLHANPANLDTAYIAGAALTQGPNHLIHGRGRIYAPLINNGTVNADEDGLVLAVQSVSTNNALMAATNGGVLDFVGGSLTQSAAGQILAADATVRFSAASISGGTVAATGTGLAIVSSPSTFNSVTLDGPSQINNSQFLVIGGSGLTHAGGNLTINPTAGGSGTYIRFDAPGSISGPGIIALNASAGNLDTAFVTSSAAANTYSNGAGHTIRGTGRLAGNMINNGTVSADVGGRTLEVIANPTTNHALFSASNGGILQFSSTSVVNSGGIIAADAATVNFNAMGLTGGQVNLTGGGVGRIVSSSTFTDVSINGPFEINNSQILAVGGSALTHTGSLTINPVAGGSGTLIRFDAPASLLGSGAVVLNANSGNLDTSYITSSAAANTYTNGAGHTIRGTGRLAGNMVNNGIVTADVPGRVIEVIASPTVNNALFSASGAGTLQFSSNNVNNTGGTIAADAATVNFNAMGLTGGQVNLTSTGVGRVVGSSTFTNVAVNGSLEINNAQILAIAGAALTHTGTITVNPNAGGSGTLIRFDAPASFLGSGVLVLNANPANLDTAYISSSAAANTYTNGAGHTIRGLGRLHGNMINNGTVNADVPTRAIEVQANPTINNALFTATNGGVLQFTSNNVANSGASIVADAATVNFNSMGLTGGQINTTNGGVGRVVGSSTFTDVTASGTLEVNNSQTLVIGGAGFTHSGTLTVNPAAGGSGTLIRFDASGSLSGPGSVVLNANPGNFDTAYINTSGAAVCTNAQGHTIAGRGRIYGNFVNNGTIAPGSAADSTALIERQGAYVAGSTSTIDIDLDGTTQGNTYDLFRSTGAMTLGGTLTVRLAPGYIPPRNTAFTIITAPSVSGIFTTVNLPVLPPTIGYARLQYLPGSVRVLIPLCPTDWNGMDGINSQDFFDFLSDFFSNTGDFNFDGFINSQDFFDFLTSFFGGCAG